MLFLPNWIRIWLDLDCHAHVLTRIIVSSSCWCKTRTYNGRIWHFRGNKNRMTWLLCLYVALTIKVSIVSKVVFNGLIAGTACWLVPLCIENSRWNLYAQTLTRAFVYTLLFYFLKIEHSIGLHCQSIV